MIEIERIEIVTPIHGRPGAVMAQRVETIDGRTRFIEPIDLLIGFDGTELPPEVQDALAAINTQQQNTIVELKEQLTTLTSERDAAVSQATSANEQIATLQNQLAELTAEPTVPVVSRRQARLALLQMGLFDSIESAVYSGPKGIQIEYEADVWRRDNPTLIAMVEQLGMSSEQLDQFFQLAETL